MRRTILAILVATMLSVFVFSVPVSAASFSGPSGSPCPSGVTCHITGPNSYAPSSSSTAKPSYGDGVGTWPCYIFGYAWNSSSFLVGYAYNYCSGEFAQTFISLSAWQCVGFNILGYCNSWQYKGVMYDSSGDNASCVYDNTNYVYCPTSGYGYAYWGPIAKGQYWRMITSVTTIGLDGQQAFATVENDVQF